MLDVVHAALALVITREFMHPQLPVDHRNAYMFLVLVRTAF